MRTDTAATPASEPALTPALPFTVALGHRLRQVREELGQTAAEIAWRSRLIGLKYDASTVVRIELGQRQVSAAELLLLAVMYGKGVADLLPTEPAQLNEAAGATPDQMRTALTKAPAGWELPRLRAAFWRGLDNVQAAAQRWEANYPGTSIAALALGRPVDQTVKDAAKRLGVTTDEVLMAAGELWEHSLTQERDERVAALGPSTARGKQARRGHVTRSLLDELRVEIPKLRQPRDDADDGEEQARG